MTEINYSTVYKIYILKNIYIYIHMIYLYLYRLYPLTFDMYPSNSQDFCGDLDLPPSKTIDVMIYFRENS